MRHEVKDDDGEEAEVESGLTEDVGLNFLLSVTGTTNAPQQNAAHQDLSLEITGALMTNEDRGVRICTCQVERPVIVVAGHRVRLTFSEKYPWKYFYLRRHEVGNIRKLRYFFRVWERLLPVYL